MDTRSQDQRREPRSPCDKAGNYVKMAEPESLHQGGTAVLNISSEGMLLHMPKAYDPGSIIEVNLADARNGRFTTILEARWSKFHKLPERPFEYLIGCRALFAIFS